MNSPALIDYANETHLLVRRGMTGATGNYYVGLHEFEDMAFVGHALRAGDLFVDVGANIGSYSILAASCGASVIAFEPVTSTFRSLRMNVAVNGFEGKINALQCSVGETAGVVTFTTTADTTNHVALGEETGESVPVVTLDSEIPPDRTCIVKIDVEGFESHVLAGAERLLSSGRVLALVVELNGGGKRYGVSDSEVHKKLLAFGYQARSYDPWHRTLAPAGQGSEGNTLYVRDSEIDARLRSAPPISVLGTKV